MILGGESYAFREFVLFFRLWGFCVCGMDKKMTECKQNMIFAYILLFFVYTPAM